MVKLLLVIGAVLAATVTRSDGAVLLIDDLKTQKPIPGRPAEFSCQVTSGTTFVAWVTPSRPGTGITSERITVSQASKDGRKTVEEGVDTYKLKISNVEGKDGGVYTCEGSDASVTKTLNTHFDPNPATRNQELTQGKQGKIVLDVIGYPTPSYTWKKDGKPVIFDASRTLNLNTGSITIANVQQKDGGDYTCTISAGDDRADVEITVTINVKPTIRKYQGNPVNSKLTQGNNVTFHCDIQSGNPKPDVTWWFGWADTDKEVDTRYDGRYSHPNEDEWAITGIDTQDVGKYRCRAKNTAGEDFLRFEILSVDIPPTIDPLQDEVVVNEGDDAVLECTASGTPKPEVNWYFKGSLLNQQEKYAQGDKSGARIKIPKVRLINSGEYSCRAKNGALDGDGKVIVKKESTNLYVKSPPKINTEVSPTPVYSFVGNRKDATIACVFYGYPIPTVIMTDVNGTEIARGNGTVSKVINPTSESDFGVYNCSATSEDGYAEHLVEFKKAVAPGSPRNVSADKTCKEIILTWDAPASNGGMEIIQYIITVSDGKVVPSKSTGGDAREHTISNGIMPKTNYRVKLQARSAAGYGPDEILTVMTDEFCVPGKPSITNTEYQVDRENFIVTWTAPQYNGGDNNTKYRLEWRKTPITEDTEVGSESNIAETRFKITGLEANTEYEIRLYSVNRQGDSEPAMQKFKTNAEAAKTTSPSQPPGTPTSSPRTTENKQTAIPSTGKPTALTTPDAIEPPKVGARTGGLGAGAIAGIVVAIILIVLITIDLFCCFFNSCGIIFCCHRAICGGGGGGVKSSKEDYKDGKATEMEKQPLPENV